MNTESIINASELNVCYRSKPMPKVAFDQSMNALLPGDVLRINACSKTIASRLVEYCSNIGHTLLEHIEIDDEATLYIRKNV